MDLKRFLPAVAAVGLFAALPFAGAAEPTAWFHDARWGVMTHYLGAPPSSKGGAELTAETWNKQVNEFDVAGLVDQVASTGAKYLLFTLGQNSGHYCSPNATYDRIVGITPSKCSRRDLVTDLAKALSVRNIRLMVYLPSGAPAADPVARHKLGWRWGRPGGWQLPGEPVGGRLVEFQRDWEAVIREWSLRWGKSVSGWWIDGCYFADQMYRFDDAPNFASFAAALKSGNPDAIVAFNPGVKVPVIGHTKYDAYTAGEVDLPKLAKAVEACHGRWMECEGCKLQFHILTYLGKSWCKGDRPQLPDEQIIAFTRQLTEKGGVMTFDVPIQNSGLIPQPFIEQLQAVGRSMNKKTAKVTVSGQTVMTMPGVLRAMDLPVFHHKGIALDYAGLKYNPCNDIIIPSVIRTDDLQKPLGRYYMYYARVFRYTIPGKDNRYIMLLMGNNRGTRRIYLAWSKDGRSWEPRRTSFIDPQAPTGQLAQAWHFPWQGKHYLIYHDYSTRGTDLHVSEVDPTFEHVRYIRVFYDHTAASPDNVAQMSPCFLEENGKVYMYTNIGPRLHQKIALAVAEVGPGR